MVLPAWSGDPQIYNQHKNDAKMDKDAPGVWKKGVWGMEANSDSGHMPSTQIIHR